jgi:type I restriction enzyme S subunit
MENGKAAVVRGLLNGLGFGSTEFHVLRSTGAVFPDYVYHFIRQEWFRRAAEQEMTGSVGQKRVPATFLEATAIPLPPLAEQQRIVAKVEALLARVNAARQRLAKAPAILKRFRQSVLAAACSGHLTADWRSQNESNVEKHLVEWMRKHPDRQIVNGLPDELDADLPALPEEWTWTAVGDVASAEARSMQSGPFGSNLLHSEFQNKEYWQSESTTCLMATSQWAASTVLASQSSSN